MKEDFLVNGEQLLALDIRSASFSGSKQWRNYVAPVTEVRVLPSGPRHSCISENGVTTFDSQVFPVSEEGSHVLYRHTRLPLEIQVVYRRCNLRELCHCSVAVRAGPAVIIFDICTRGYMQVWAVGRNGDIIQQDDLPDGIKLLSLDEGRSYEVCNATVYNDTVGE